mmetsp:Transcript_17604/g.28666  ORF Transcript_17604/g.28666 Transcript_17604/m.28666 type:complete len:82 (+) Transcript_17604:818-1063(+)
MATLLRRKSPLNQRDNIKQNDIAKDELRIVRIEEERERERERESPNMFSFAVFGCLLTDWFYDISFFLFVFSLRLLSVSPL